MCAPGRVHGSMGRGRREPRVIPEKAQQLNRAGAAAIPPPAVSVPPPVPRAADVRWLGPILARAALEALAGRLSCYDQYRGMICDRQTGHIGDHVDAFGPLPGHTWPREDVVVKPAEGSTE